MSETTEATVPPPVGWTGRLLSAVSLGCAIFGGLGTVAIMALINADVIGRSVFATPMPATAEIVSAAIVAIVFLQLPYATQAGRAVRSDMLIGRLRRRTRSGADWLDALHHGIGALMLAVLLRYTWPEVTGAISGDETVGLYGVLQLPRWPFLLAVLVGCFLTFVQYATLAYRFARRAAGAAQ